MSSRLLTALALALAFAASAFAQTARPAADDPALEAQVQRIAHELRCLVCQNETIAASNADLAVDLRAQIRRMLREGQTEPQILDFMVQRYGDFVLYSPPVKPTTWLLWGGPFVLLALMLVWLWRLMIRRRAQVQAAARPLTDDERRRAEALLGTRDPA